MLWGILRPSVFLVYKNCLIDPLYGESKVLKFYPNNLQFMSYGMS